MSEYSFNTNTAKHLFCKTCGVVPFYRPRSNPGCYGVTLGCLDDKAAAGKATINSFDGQNWETAVETSGIRRCAK